MLAGCGGKDDTTDSANTNTNTDAGTGTDDSGVGGNSGEVTELTFYNADLTEDDPWTDPIAQILTEKTGVKLNVDHPVGEDKQRISLMIAEQNFPDLIYAKGDAGSLIDAGVMIDMTELIEEYGPNIRSVLILNG